MSAEDMITVTVERRDAVAMVLGPLDYAVKVMEGEVAAGASPMRIRQALAQALRSDPMPPKQN